MTAVILIAHAVSTCAMAGILVFVQIVAYPLFGHVAQDDLGAYEDAHARRTSLVVGPVMVVEGLTAVLLVFDPPTGLGRGLPVIGLGLLLVVWASTAFVQVPIHAAMSRGGGPGLVRALVVRNWPRTIAWVARAGVVAAMLAR